MRIRILGCFVLVAAAVITPAARVAADPSGSITDLAGKSLEELGEYRVDAPTRTTLALAETPGAVSVLTYDQIRRRRSLSCCDSCRA